MELKIYSPQDTGFIQKIDWNYDELKKEIAAAIESYANSVYTDDMIKKAKEDRAKLNKVSDALKKERTRIRKKLLEPDEQFGKEVQELTGMIQKAASNIDDQIKGYEERLREEKTAKVREFYEDNIHDIGKYLPFERVMQPRYALASTTMKSIKEEILALIQKVDEGLAVLNEVDSPSGLSPGSIITDALNDMTQMSAATGDETSIWKLIGDKIADNEDYSLLTETIEQQTGMIPDVAIEAITSRNPDVEAAAKSILETIKDTFAGGVQAEIPITLDTVTTYRTGGLTGTVRQPIEHHAKGGLMESPTLSWFAEESPEMAIPLNGSDRSLRLWQETGQALGAYKEVDYDQIYFLSLGSG